jgi:hypothetical protein
MKKTILTIAALTAFGVNSLFAQVSFGPKLGLNISNINDKVVDANQYQAMDFKSRVGFHVGGVVNAQISDYFSIRPELVYSTAGAKIEESGVKMQINYSYLSLPINFVGSLPISDDFKLQAIVGPYFALGLGGKVKTEFMGVTDEQTIKMKKDPLDPNDTNFYLNSLDMGLNFGIGAQYKSFVLSATYGLGLSNIESHYTNSQDEDLRGDSYKWTNRNISIGVAYLFGGK